MLLIVIISSNHLDSQMLSLVVTSGNGSKVYSKRTPWEAITNKDSVILDLLWRWKILPVCLDEALDGAKFTASLKKKMSKVQ